VTVARSIEDLMRVISIRSAVYIGEQECPYLEEIRWQRIFKFGPQSSRIRRQRTRRLPAAFAYFADFCQDRAPRRPPRNSVRSGFSLPLVEAAIDSFASQGLSTPLWPCAENDWWKFWSQFGFGNISPVDRELIFFRLRLC